MPMRRLVTCVDACVDCQGIFQSKGDSFVPFILVHGEQQRCSTDVQGIRSMKVGGTRLLYVPASMVSYAWHIVALVSIETVVLLHL